MRRPHLLRVAAEPEAFGPLVAMARAVGLRVGWLVLGPTRPPSDLDSAASLGVLRAVAVGEGRAVGVKPLAGPPVLSDLLREYFLGCGLVLVQGKVEAPVLAPAEASGEVPGWEIRLADGSVKRFDTPSLVARLRSPRPLGDAASARC